jgi:hypothetical protein
MDARLEQYIATETARAGLRMSPRQSPQERMRQLARYTLLQRGMRNATDEEVDAIVGLLMLQFDQPRRITRSMVKRS